MKKKPKIYDGEKGHLRKTERSPLWEISDVHMCTGNNIIQWKTEIMVSYLIDRYPVHIYR